MPKSKALETCPRCGNALAAGHCEACGYPGEDIRNARSSEDGCKRPDGCKGKKDGCKLLDSCGMKDSCRLGTPEEPEEMEDGCKGRKVKADGISKSQVRAEKIRLDGAVEHEVPEAVAQHIDGLNAKVASIAQIQADKADA